MKTQTLYQVREFVGADYSRPLGRRLRTRPQAQRIARALRNAGREIILARIKVAR